MAKMKLHLVATLVLSVALVLPCIAAAKSVEEKPSGFAMAGDLLIARPLGLAFLAIGTVVYVASLPIALLGGNAKEVGRTLVIEPALETFVRCLGCTRLGRKEKIAK
jgi:hypothetical protein